MALTDQQYQQVFKYADNEMDADELTTFEAALVENMELRDEVEFYKQVRLLGESVEEKTRGTDQWLSEEKKSRNEETWEIISEARKQWENQHEAALKLTNEINSTGDRNIPSFGRKPKIVKMTVSKWLAVAVVVGLVCLSAGLWYLMSDRDSRQPIVTNKALDSVEPGDKGVPSIPTTDSTDISDSFIIGEKKPQENLAKKNEKIKALFKNNFTPDAAPADKEGPLENALSYYETKQYEKAGQEFENVEIGPATRGLETENQKLATFYLPYYKALSYIAANVNNSKAIAELKKAVATSPDELSKTRARWYLALAHLSKGEIEPAQALLKQVAANDESKELKQKATTLRKALTEL